MVEVKRIQSLMRAMDILENLSAGSRTLTELSKELGLHAATLFQLISTLESRDFVSKDSQTKKYSLGFKIAELNESLWNSDIIRQTARPFLKQLGDLTRETSHLAIYKDNAISITEVEPCKRSPGSLIVTSEVGQNEPSHSTAVGKAILAWLPDKALDAVLEKRLKKFTGNTITSKKKLMDHLQSIRKQGYAVDDEENAIGVRCIASPVFGKDGILFGSIGISGPVVRIIPSKIPGLGKIAKGIAEELSRNLGYTSL